MKYLLTTLALYLSIALGQSANAMLPTCNYTIVTKDLTQVIYEAQTLKELTDYFATQQLGEVFVVLRSSVDTNEVISFRYANGTDILTTPLSHCSQVASNGN